MENESAGNDYILITPCKNEENNLPNLIMSVMAQTIRPVMWVIVNDASTDTTFQVIDEAEKRFDIIKGVHLHEEGEYLGSHIAHVYNSGFEAGLQHCSNEGRNWDYIAILDADTIAEPQYFEKLFREFKKDPELGLASGNTCDYSDNVLAYLEQKGISNSSSDASSSLSLSPSSSSSSSSSPSFSSEKPVATGYDGDVKDDSGPELKRGTEGKSKSSYDNDLYAPLKDPQFWDTYSFSFLGQPIREDLPMGSARVWRRKCFEEGGLRYEDIPIPDAVAVVKAKVRGWNTRCFSDIKIIERQGLSARGHWYGHRERGIANYSVCLPLSLVGLKAVNYSLKGPLYAGVAYLYGYSISFIQRRRQVQDEDVRQYYRNDHSSTTIRYNLDKFKRKYIKK